MHVVITALRLHCGFAVVLCAGFLHQQQIQTLVRRDMADETLLPERMALGLDLCAGIACRRIEPKRQSLSNDTNAAPERPGPLGLGVQAYYVSHRFFLEDAVA